MRYYTKTSEDLPSKVKSLTATFCLSFTLLLNATAFGQPSEELTHGLFDSEDVLTIELSGNVHNLLKDRSDDMEYHPLTLTYEAKDRIKVSIPIKAKTRGNFRRLASNCRYPPLLLNFSKEATPDNSIFHNQDKLKLVTPCTGDKYIVHEYLVYKVFNLITGKSFRARLVNVIFQDNEKESTQHYGILLEEEDQMAKRNNAIIIEDKSLRPEETHLDDFLKMSVFQYLIGNTDWSVQYYQNIKLIAADTMSLPSTVPYDFDHAGIVGAPMQNLQKNCC